MLVGKERSLLVPEKGSLTIILYDNEFKEVISATLIRIYSLS